MCKTRVCLLQTTAGILLGHQGCSSGLLCAWSSESPWPVVAGDQQEHPATLKMEAQGGEEEESRVQAQLWRECESLVSKTRGLAVPENPKGVTVSHLLAQLPAACNTDKGKDCSSLSPRTPSDATCLS